MKLTITHHGTQVVLDQLEISTEDLNYENIIRLVQDTITTINEQDPQNLAPNAFKLTEWEKHPSKP
jgi:hypothetical protein